MAEKLAEPPAELVAAYDALKPKQQEFVRLVLDGQTLTDAYIQSHGWKGSRLNARIEASKLARRDEISLALAAARRVAAARGQQSAELWLAESIQLQQQSVDLKQMTAAVKAHETRGKALGYLSPAEPTVGTQVNIGQLIFDVGHRLGQEARRRVEMELGLFNISGPADGESEIPRALVPSDQS